MECSIICDIYFIERQGAARNGAKGMDALYVRITAIVKDRYIVPFFTQGHYRVRTNITQPTSNKNSHYTSFSIERTLYYQINTQT